MAFTRPLARALSKSAARKPRVLDFESFANIVDGGRRSILGDNFYTGKSPETGEELWRVPKGTVKDVDDAVNAGKRAFADWARVPLAERVGRIEGLAQALQDEKDNFTQLIMAETGKPKHIASHEIDGAVSSLKYHATLEIPEYVVKKDAFTVVTRYVPYGVTAAICPWNFPLILATSKFAPSIIAGNSIIMKPSPFTPYSLPKLVELAQQFFPPGVFQCIGGGDDIGPSLVDHPGIAKVSFTGSIKTGKAIMASCAKSIKPLSLELGGNDPSIIFADIDIASTAAEVVKGAFYNSGQICVGTKRIYVHADIYDQFLAAFAAETKKMTVGPSGANTTVLGPVQNELQYKTVQGLVRDSVEQGYRFALNDPGASPPRWTQGCFMDPIVVDNPPDNARIVEEEPFGPIVPLQKWTTVDEVIQRANNTNTGLGACVWTKDLALAESVAERLEAGSVWINSHEKLQNEAAFSGWKESGLGGELGPLALMSWVRPKATHTYH